ncbi:hypothetical protein BST97_08010 [Nonlabens spongiae]|uniref:Uncharacterized protein n=1 Tax=Nonlabens spongiae TaxID=331648 RepID=A0A1W6MK15_9FLAO|nr:hypothetical protein [Nonlabens spongiae]ARN77945.1 hypothetical protein BST97_08010 [Nonlabens spongiae]
MKRFVGQLFRYGGDYKDFITDTYESAVIERAFLQDNIIRMSFKYQDSNTSVQINLKSDDNLLFIGSSKAIDEDGFSGKIKVRYYHNGKNALLIGTWIEDGEIDTCVIELQEVKEFKD